MNEALALGLGAQSLACTFPGKSGVIGRLRGSLLLGIYAAYVLALLQGWGAAR